MKIAELKTTIVSVPYSYAERWKGGGRGGLTSVIVELATEGGLSVSYEGLVIDHELLQMAHRYLRGIRVDADTLAEDVIAEVEPRGNFLAEAHTLRFLHGDEFCHSQLLNRRARDKGGRSMREAAHAQALQLLSDHPSPVPAHQQAAFQAVIAGRLEVST